eukprot:738816-Alexandrium_andersonii.AAC.1
MQFVLTTIHSSSSALGPSSYAHIAYGLPASSCWEGRRYALVPCRGCGPWCSGSARIVAAQAQPGVGPWSG